MAIAVLAAACSVDDFGSSSPAAGGTTGTTGAAATAGASADDPPTSSAANAATTTTAPPPDPSPPGATRPLRLGDPKARPTLDRDRSSVDLSSIVFDTFDGRFILLDEADDSTIDVLLDLIPPIDAPAYDTVAAADTWIGDNEVVITYSDVDGGEWAYPVRVMNFHEIVNDELAGVPVVITYCPLCGSGVVYDRRLDGRELSFSNTSALHQSDMVMVDRETGSYWWQVSGRSIVGTLTDTVLTALPSANELWGKWKADHPDGLVLARLANEQNLPDPFFDLAGRIDTGLAPRFIDPDALADDRFTPGATVVVATIGDTTAAWPVRPAGVTSSIIEGRPLTITVDGTGGTVTDTETGRLLPVRTSMWFAIAASFPDIVVPG